MKLLKHKMLVFLASLIILLFASVSSACAWDEVAVFDPQNGSEKIIFNLDELEGEEITIPAMPKAPAGKVFVGWAKQQVGEKYPEIVFPRRVCGDEKFSFDDGADHYFFAQYIPIRTAKTYPYINYSYLSENTEGYSIYRYGSEGGTPDSIYASDLYKISLTAGKKYYFELNAPGRSPWLALLDKDFNSVGEYGDIDEENFSHDYDDLITFTPEESGTYYITVNAEWYDELGAYQLIVADEQVAFPKLQIEWISQGKVFKTTETDPGEKIVAPKISRKGYTFQGWYRDISYTRILNPEDTMPVAHASFFAKWTSNDAKVKGIKTSTGTLTQKWAPTNIYNCLRIPSNKSSVTVTPIRSNAKATIYMKHAGGKYKKMNLMTVSVPRKGQTRAIYIKCVSETGNSSTSVHKLYIHRNK